MFFHQPRKRRAAWLALAVALGAGVALLHAFNPQPDPPKVFGMFGITAADMIRLNVTNVGGAVGVPPGPCRAQIGFVNASGALLKSSNVTIPDGGTATLTMTYFEASGALDALLPRVRANVRPVVQAVPPGPCFTAVSAEVADAASGRTNIYAMPQLWTPAPATAVTGAQ